jgi:hypothetical protein
MSGTTVFRFECDFVGPIMAEIFRMGIESGGKKIHSGHCKYFSVFRKVTVSGVHLTPRVLLM